MIISGPPLAAQTEISVPLEHPVYVLLEAAEMRALISPLPQTRPYSRAFVRELIGEILAGGGAISDAEIAVLEREYKRFGPAAEGGERGIIHLEGASKSGTPVVFDAAPGLFFNGSGAYYFEEEAVYGGFDFWLNVRFAGDIGTRFSYLFDLGTAFLMADRGQDGLYRISYERTGDDAYIPAWREVYAYFPFSYKSRWGGWMFKANNISASGPTGWPNEICAGFNETVEISGVTADSIFRYRFGRFDRDWGSAGGKGTSLVLNQMAQPFFGAELIVSPFSWFSFSSLTGILEYYDRVSIKDSAATSQNAFSLMMFEFSYKNVVHFNAGTSVIWPKRLELGYIFPLVDKLFYQNSVGDFDNVNIFASLKLQKSGWFSFWAQFFLDEASPEPGFFTLDRGMYASQLGIRVRFPLLPFASFTLSYTKIEPYCYTHARLETPWNTELMEESYTNHGYGIGYYLPPNSDEFKLRFETLPVHDARLYAQFQLIRHGATHGSNAVDGSSYYSELPADNRNEDPRLKKFFLADGAYQWFFVFKTGGEFALSNTPVVLFAEGGVSFLRYTNIEGNSNSGEASSYSFVDTAEYPASTSLVLSIGVKIFR
ncbi:MAG: hypothetical protein LBC77_07640 [Spirochaetaceae bacterium]|nr:hypothetical protein [Spirochaetaceae bacterium]